ncbi:hypothetical protein SPRG_02588 [Saprolegnia parasitica CBS 223.65]|uniref:Uncharacterized protein n=1 Tax=Saprolegnia parasitica (strain CBS 223.65) TaxID=695850 RepID=A0A067D1I7_SAPPC|nr:hypothetical protein SPRG_02588 [Saprolegnia parasitica CBS 223.65]KDO32897.1 hypothetical protein SPRG_02588 [Saprolegnia parasitica CBS 223.65]|eukprot:XP_012196547.1 hypothetical protein SPRG_02588 [Saprolegnia parasitica CBS 223.65]
MATQAFGSTEMDTLSPDQLDALDPVSAGLPLPLRTRYSEEDFHVLSQIGSWLATQEVKAKTHAEAIKESHRKVQSVDGSSPDDVVTVQTHVTMPMPLVPSRANAVPPICRAWVLLQCRRSDCKRRHYYISHAEREAMTLWQEDLEANLDLTALKAIAARELLIEQARAIGAKAMSKYQANLVHETKKQVQKLVHALNALRLANVRVVEAIVAWRTHVQASGRLSMLHAATDNASSLGWSVSITVLTGKYLYRGSNAFLSKIKRYCRDADVHGEKETQVRYLGCYPTKVQAEAAYDSAVVSEARRLHTTVDHMPRKRYVFLSCGAHCAIESDVRHCSSARTVCVECRTRAQTKVEPWIPTYIWHNVNYLLKMGSDLGFLEAITPLRLYVGPSFPLDGNPFLIPTETPRDAQRFLELAVPTSAPNELLPTAVFTRHADNLVTWTHPETDATHVANPHHLVRLTSENIQMQYEVLDMPRLVEAQKVYLRELGRNNLDTSCDAATQDALRTPSTLPLDEDPTTRIVQALYWDRCAALRIEQVRPPRAYKLKNVWCRTDVGEWAGFRVRGKHIRHHAFESKLCETGKKNIQTRAAFVARLRSYMQQPLEALSRREMVDLLAEAEVMRGDLVHLEAENLRRFLAKYDAMTAAAWTLQLWWRRTLARWIARLRALALRTLAHARRQFEQTVTSVANVLYAAVVATATQRVMQRLRDGVVSTCLKLDGEHVIVTYHSMDHYDTTNDDVNHQRTPCSHCLRMAYHRSVQLQSFCFRQERSLCYCGKRREPERILVRAYNPATNDVYRLLIGNEQLRQLVRPHVDGNVRRACDLLSLPTDRILGYDLKAIGGRPRTSWDPIREAARAHQVASAVETLAASREAHAATTSTHYNAWRALHTDTLHRKKHAWNWYQKALAQVERSMDTLASATVHAKEAVAFSEKGRTTFAGEASWDPLENANNWRLLVAKRQSARDVVEKEAQFQAARTAWFHAEMNEASARALTAHAKERYDVVAAEAKRTRLLANDYRAMATAARLMLRATTRVLNALLTLRQYAPVPIRRTLLLLDGPVLQHYHGRPTALHAVVSRRRFAYNLLAARARMVRMDPIPYDARRQELWMLQVRMLAESTACDEGVLVTAYRPHDAKTVDTWVEWRFLHLLVDCPRFRDPDMPIFEAQHAIAASKTRHGNAMMQKRLVMTARAHILMALMRLNSFTAEIDVGRLAYFRLREVLHRRLLQSHWWHDVLAGRKRGRGDEVYRQAANIDGRRCHVLIFENYGDIRIQVYEPRRRNHWTLVVPLVSSIDALRASPEKLSHWLACVRTNKYSDAVFQPLLQHLTIHATNGLTFARPRAKIVWRGVRFVCNRYLLVTIRQDAWLGLRLSVGSENHADAPIRGETSIDAHGCRVLFPTMAPGADMYTKLADMVTLTPSSTHMSTDGDALAAAISAFNSWIETTTRWRNPLSPVDSGTARLWACLLDAKKLRQPLSSAATVVLTHEVPLHDKMRRCVYAADYILDASRDMQAKIEVWPRHGAMVLRLRRELFHEWEARQEGKQRAAMATEEARTHLSILHARRSDIQRTLRQYQRRLRDLQNDLVASTVAVASVLETQHRRQCTLLAMQYILTMAVHEVVGGDRAPKAYALRVGHNIEWLETPPYVSSCVYLKPTTTSYEPNTAATLATTAIVGAFSRPLQFFVYIYVTDASEVWRVDAYCKTIGVLLTHFISVAAFVHEVDYHLPALPPIEMNAKALSWLAQCSVAPPDASATMAELWTHLVGVRSERSFLSHTLQRLTALEDVLERALAVVDTALALTLDDIDQLADADVAPYFYMLCDPDALPTTTTTTTTTTTHTSSVVSEHTLSLHAMTEYGMLLHADISLGIEEVFADLWTPDVAASVLASPDVKAIPALHGTLFAASSGSNVNLRATTLANVVVYGPAIYTTTSHVFHDLVLATQWTSDTVKKKAVARRGAPWRAYASDRMRLARAAKPNQSHLPRPAVVIATLDDGGPPSTELLTLGQYAVSRKAFELLEGYARQVDGGAMSLHQHAVQRVLDAISVDAHGSGVLSTKPLDLARVYSGTLSVPLDQPSKRDNEGSPDDVITPSVVRLRVDVRVNNVAHPTALVVDAYDDDASSRAHDYRVTIGVDEMRVLVPRRPVHGDAWAALAVHCLAHLTLCQRNGRRCLAFLASTRSPPVTSIAPPTAMRVPHPFVAFLRPVAPFTQVDALAETMVLARLQKHTLSSVQARIAARQRSLALQSAKAALEWAGMEASDAESTADRGFLTLPTKSLHKLKTAYDKAMAKAVATDVGRARAFWRSLASTLHLPDDVLPAALTVGLPSFYVVAELWRQYLVTPPQATPEGAP